MTFLPAVRVVDSSPVYQLKILLIAGAVFENTTFPMETLEMESLSTCEAENFIVSVSSETSLAESSATLPLAPMYSSPRSRRFTALPSFSAARISRLM